MNSIARSLRALCGMLPAAAGVCAVLTGIAPPVQGEPAHAGSEAQTIAVENPVDGLLFASPTTRDHIGRVVVPVRINGRGPFRFIVDTGADHSTISPALVQVLGLTADATASIVLNGITGSSQVAFVRVDRLQAGDLTMDELALPVVWAPVMAGADGILGAAGLTEKTLLIDFQRNRVAISRSVDGAIRAQSTKIHALRPTHGLITLDTEIGRVSVRAVVDTGAERTLGNIALRDALKARPGPRALAMVTSVYGATKEVETGEIQMAPTINIGSLRISDVAIVYGPFHIFKTWQMEDKPAMIIGMDVLGTVASLTIDFKHQDVYVASVQASTEDTLSTAHTLSDQSMKR